MAVLAFGLAGAAIGSTAGMATLGFTIGQAVGQLVMAGDKQNAAPEPQDGGARRINENILQNSTYGAVIPVGYGVYRASGNVVYSSGIRRNTRQVVVGEQDGVEQFQDQEYLSADIAVAFGEVPLHRTLETDDTVITFTSESQEDGETISLRERSSFVGVLRLWMNGQLFIDERTGVRQPTKDIDYTVYLGTDSQQPDETIQAGLDDLGQGTLAPAYRGTIYVVLKNLDLTQFGDRLPQISAEVYERMTRVDTLEEGVEGVCLDTDGELWVTSSTTRVIQRIDPNTLRVTARVGRQDRDIYPTYPIDQAQYLGGLPAQPWRCVADPMGHYIYICHKASPHITVVQRSTNLAAAYDVPQIRFSTDIETDDDGNIWVTAPFQHKVYKFARPTSFPTRNDIITGSLLAQNAGDGQPKRFGRTLTQLAEIDIVSKSRSATAATVPNPDYDPENPEDEPEFIIEPSVIETNIADAPWSIRHDSKFACMWVSGAKWLHQVPYKASTNANWTLNQVRVSEALGTYFHGDMALVDNVSGVSVDQLWLCATGSDVARIIERGEGSRVLYFAAEGKLESTVDPDLPNGPRLVPVTTEFNAWVNKARVQGARNVGTIPLGADSHPDDPFKTIYLTTFQGNRIRAYTPADLQQPNPSGTGVPVFPGRDAQFNAGTIAFPGKLVANPDGTAFFTNTRTGIVQKLESR